MEYLPAKHGEGFGVFLGGKSRARGQGSARGPEGPREGNTQGVFIQVVSAFARNEVLNAGFGDTRTAQQRELAKAAGWSEPKLVRFTPPLGVIVSVMCNASPGKDSKKRTRRFHLPLADAVRPLNHLDGIGELRSQQANRGTVLPVRQGENEVALRMPLNRGDI